jgi:surface protein
MNTIDAKSLVEINPDVVSATARSSPGVYIYNPPELKPIQATYDSFYQTITVTGLPDLLIETKDPEGNVIGSGMTGVDGTVTYSFNEGSIPDKSILETSGKNTTVVQHELIASSRFLYEAKTPNYIAAIDLFDSGSGAEVFIDWGDGSTFEVSNSIADNQISIGYPHTFVEPGDYVVNLRVKGGFAEVRVHNHHKLLEWGPLENYIIQNSGSAFYEVVPSDISPLITSCKDMFASCSKFNQSLDHWNMENVTSTSGMFMGCKLYNQPLNNWNTSNFKQLSDMFYGAEVFDQALNNWNLEKATSFIGMFSGCRAFNQDLSSWKTPLATSMQHMFYQSTVFNQDLSNWCVPLIESEPNNFNVGGLLTEEHKPVWGTCPAK